MKAANLRAIWLGDSVGARLATAADKVHALTRSHLMHEPEAGPFRAPPPTLCERSLPRRARSRLAARYRPRHPRRAAGPRERRPADPRTPPR